MESIFDFILILSLVFSVGCNVIVIVRTQRREEDVQNTLAQISESLRNQNENYSFTKNKIDVIGINLASYRSELKENLETPKPIKPNNWDSMKEAFKGPTKVEINERN